MTFAIRLGNLRLVALVPELRADFPVTLSRGVEKPIAEFEADGKCKILGAGKTTDCGF